MYSACPKCHGEGRLLSLSKAQRAQLRESPQDTPASLAPAKSLRCPACSGTGVTIFSSSADCGPLVRAASPGNVAIIGAGIGGTALALALQQRGIRVRVYERDISFDIRKQGYGLTMQKVSGGQALAALGCTLDGVGTSRHLSLSSDGRLLGEYGFSVHHKCSSTPTPLQQDEGLGKRNVHLPRQALRKALIERLHPGTIQWGCRLVRYTDHPDATHEYPEGAVELHFEDGRAELADVCVGADGLFSNVRTQKLNDPLNFLNLIVILGIVRGTTHDLCQQTVFQVLDGTTRIYVMPFSSSPDGDGIIPPVDGESESESHAMMWQLSFPCSETEARNLSRDNEELLATALARCEGWPAPIRDLLSRTHVQMMAGYPAYDRDVVDGAVLRGNTDSRKVTLIGDAAHPMSPFKGQGANQALVDAVQLARFLFRAPRFSQPNVHVRNPFRDTQESLAASERAMCERAAGKVRASREAAQALHSPDALREGNCVRARAASRKN